MLTEHAVAIVPLSMIETQASLSRAAAQLLRLEEELVEFEESMKASLERVPADHRESAKNLVYYVALRQHDLRDLQQELSQLGLSSLGRSESCVLRSVREVSARAHESLSLQGHESARTELSRLESCHQGEMSWETARGYLQQHTRDIFGSRPADRRIYIMVTAPSAQEADREWMIRLLRAGMNVLRINCAHEGEKEWSAMIDASGAGAA